MTARQSVSDDLRELQEALAKAEYWKARAEAAEESKEEWKKESDNWRQLFLDERKRAETLVSASGDRQSASQEMKLAYKALVDQVNSDREFEKGQYEELKRCERGKLGYAVKGFGVGFGTALIANPWGR